MHCVCVLFLILWKTPIWMGALCFMSSSWRLNSPIPQSLVLYENNVLCLVTGERHCKLTKKKWDKSADIMAKPTSPGGWCPCPWRVPEWGGRHSRRAVVSVSLCWWGHRLSWPPPGLSSHRWSGCCCSVGQQTAHTGVNVFGRNQQWFHPYSAVNSE